MHVTTLPQLEEVKKWQQIIETMEFSCLQKLYLKQGGRQFTHDFKDFAGKLL
jgi:hypothetical protein